MHQALLHSHSGLRWIVVILVVYAFINALIRKDEYEKKDQTLYKLAMIFTHVQFTVGLVLYFVSPKVKFVDGWMKNDMLRFFGMEHLVGMLLFVVLVTLAKSKSEKIEGALQKQKKARFFFGLAIIALLVFIPWPFREALGGAWV